MVRVIDTAEKDRGLMATSAVHMTRSTKAEDRRGKDTEVRRLRSVSQPCVASRDPRHAGPIQLGLAGGEGGEELIF